MKQIFVLRETQKTISIHNETYQDLLAALKFRNPQATELVEDEELSQLHDLLLLLKLKRLRVHWGSYDKGNRFLMLEIVMP